jgi:hypothetical protein
MERIAPSAATAPRATSPGETFFGTAAREATKTHPERQFHKESRLVAGGTFAALGTIRLCPSNPFVSVYQIVMAS